MIGFASHPTSRCHPIGRQFTICLTGEESITPELPPLASSLAASWRQGRVTSPRQRVGSWAPVIPVILVPFVAGGDNLDGPRYQARSGSRAPTTASRPAGRMTAASSIRRPTEPESEVPAGGALCPSSAAPPGARPQRRSRAPSQPPAATRSRLCGEHGEDGEKAPGPQRGRAHPLPSRWAEVPTSPQSPHDVLLISLSKRPNPKSRSRGTKTLPRARCTSSEIAAANRANERSSTGTGNDSSAVPANSCAARAGSVVCFCDAFVLL